MAADAHGRFANHQSIIHGALIYYRFRVYFESLIEV